MPRIEDAPTACYAVDVGIFETAEMTLVGAVEQVVGDDIELTELADTAKEEVSADGGVEKRVGGCGGLCASNAVVMVLLEVVLNSDADIGIVKEVVCAVVIGGLMGMVRCVGVVVAVVCEFPFHFSRKTGGRCEGQVA